MKAPSTPISAHAFTLAVVGLLLSGNSHACSCYFSGSHDSRVRYEFQAASAVFSAHVLRVTAEATPEGPKGLAELRVLEVWKGPLEAGGSVVVEAYDDGVSCVRSVDAGQDLLIYVFGPPPYHLDHCSLTALLAASERDRPLLNKLSGRKETSATSNGEQLDGVVVTGSREKMKARLHELKPVSDHLESIRSPRRRVAADTVGLAASKTDGSSLLVVGSLAEADLKQLLAGAEFKSTPSKSNLAKVVGDQEYARFYFGDPEKDPCCFAEWTYSKESGEWKRIFEHWRSH